MYPVDNQMEIEEIYSEIGNSINDDWEKAIIEAEIEDDNGELYRKYINKSGSEGQFESEFTTYKLFKELRNYFENTKGGKWDKAIFTLESSGKFDIEFEYNE